MSKVMKRSTPVARTSAAAPTTPAAGPERIVRTGSSRASRAPIALPLDCITRSRAARRSRSSRPRWEDIRGATYALTTVVESRSNSRYSARMRWDTESGRPSGVSARASRRSLAGLA